MNKYILDKFNAGLIADSWGTVFSDRNVLTKHVTDERWITINSSNGRTGSKVKISASGEILAGMGGKFNGQKIDKMGEKEPTYEEVTESKLTAYKSSIKAHAKAIKESKKLKNKLELLRLQNRRGQSDDINNKMKEIEQEIKENAGDIDRTMAQQSKLNNDLPAYLRSSSTKVYKP